jgi:hypothetical protein
MRPRVADERPARAVAEWRLFSGDELRPLGVRELDPRLATVGDYYVRRALEILRRPRGARKLSAYLVELVEEMSTASGREAFLLRAHLGEFSLWLSGLFPDYVGARLQRKGAPGIEYYEQLGTTGYRLAADTTDARRCGMDAIYDSCAQTFPELRLALNRVADRHLFPLAGDPIERLLRQVRDAAQS